MLQQHFLLLLLLGQVLLLLDRVKVEHDRLGLGRFRSDRGTSDLGHFGVDGDGFVAAAVAGWGHGTFDDFLQRAVQRFLLFLDIGEDLPLATTRGRPVVGGGRRGRLWNEELLGLGSLVRFRVVGRFAKVLLEETKRLV